MTRKHTAIPWRADHKQRANVAVRAARWVRRQFNRMRLWWIGRKERNVYDHASDLVSMYEAIPAEIRNAHHKLAQFAEQRRRIEWELT
ncbi:hypothetical protein [Pseudoduganella chitinolytica]|uniref:Transposase n=1 Tax=Pseudoduganella chitinolytica TaxID=34070 RepID=A0ABY8BGE8_9BURK|nr:hypothetical protein [Pseudoduganella chitinolytica]WEF34900.1 hypothetical protein PX653_09110 [Pseudoduganella chitinolytica]